MKQSARPVLDVCRLAAALLVITIHTAPLSDVNAEADFFLTRVLARVAVPYFFMLTGYFLEKGQWRRVGRTLGKTALLYALSVLLYLPLNLYAGAFSPFAPGQLLKELLVDGTFYHLWYLPAVLLGVPVAWGLRRLGWKGGLAAAGALYLLGLMGDSYYGFAARVPFLKAFYEGLFTVSSYTRNGLFFAPLFLLLGALCTRVHLKWAWPAAAGFFAAMCAEAFLLKGAGAPRHDSMYVMLPLCMLALFCGLARSNAGRCRAAAGTALWVYLLHPWCIVLVRGAAKVLGLQGLLVESGPGHFAAVALGSFALAFCVQWAAARLAPVKMPLTARAWREVDLAALCRNAQALMEALGGCGLMAVLKADAYGHGAVKAAKALRRSGVRAFAVATAAEGIALRRALVRGEVLVLGYTPPEQAHVLRRWRLSQAVADEAHAKALAAAGPGVRVHVALDTGMHRLGIPAQDTAAILRVYGMKNLRVEGIFSHLCVSDMRAPQAVAYTRWQTQRFQSAVQAVRAAGFEPGQVHLQASYGVLNGETQGFDYARVGIALYGVLSDAAPTVRRLPLRPALALRARVASVRWLKPGQGAGYGLAFAAQRPTRLACVTIGYADGVPRDFALRGGQVLIGGQRAQAVGRVCMDQMLVDVTEVKEVRPGSVVTLIGTDGGQTLRAEEFAAVCGTITNEALTRLSPRVAYVWKN
ncbi:MAG: serine racemase VanT catalytic subunit [Oscillospiraceae bacterium]|nr:serine racemase VanT catalytic subunit [Oscillospiraceae bacterium]